MPSCSLRAGLTLWSRTHEQTFELVQGRVNRCSLGLGQGPERAETTELSGSARYLLRPCCPRSRVGGWPMPGAGGREVGSGPCSSPRPSNSTVTRPRIIAILLL